MELETLPGIGPQLAARIRQRFRTDAAFFDAARRMDLQAIAQVEGLSERRAVDLVLAAQGTHQNEAFFGTPAVRRIHDRIMQRLLRYAATETGRNRLRLLHPLPSQTIADNHIAQVMSAKQAAEGLDAGKVRRLLQAMHPPQPTRPVLETGLLVVAESDETYERLHGLGVSQWATLGTPRELGEAEAYDVVVIAYDEGTIDGSSLSNAIEVSADSELGQLCPASMLRAVEQDARAIEACAELGALFDRPSVAPQLQQALEGGVASVVSPESVYSAVKHLRAELDTELEQLVGTLQLSGPELLRAMSAGKLPAPIQSVVDDLLRQARTRLLATTGLSFQPFKAGLPLGVDDDEVERVVQEAAAGHQLKQFQRRQATAAKVAKLLPELHDEMRAWLELDAQFALGCFALEHDLHPPVWSQEMRFDSSIHLELAHSSQAQRIAYRLGGDENVAVLTGANSGGKSTLLEHLCQIALMARMGLPVVGANVHVPWLDEIHLVTARRGMDAGAFETFLRGFLPVTQGDARRLVLADEVESITELEAAGRIIAFVLDRLAARDSLAVVVTHLAPQVLSQVKSARVRVDGIEATGLDEQHRLIVNRCPKMGEAARSTPELIVQRLAATTRGDEQQMYTDLLNAFAARHA